MRTSSIRWRAPAWRTGTLSQSNPSGVLIRLRWRQVPVSELHVVEQHELVDRADQIEEPFPGHVVGLRDGDAPIAAHAAERTSSTAATTRSRSSSLRLA